MRDEKLHAIVARSTFPSQHVQASCDVEKVPAVVVRSTKCTKHTTLRPLLEIEMSKKSARRGGAKQILKSKC
jgi:hypothetical protein